MYIQNVLLDQSDSLREAAQHDISFDLVFP